MKRTLALLLTLAMLLGMVGTVTVAAAGAALPEFTATVDKDGNVTVKLPNGDKDFDSVEVDVGKDYWHSPIMELTYDETKKAFVGQNPNAADGVFFRVTLSKTVDKYNDDKTTHDYSSKEYDIYYNRDGYYKGELSSYTKTEYSYSEKKKDDDWIDTARNSSTETVGYNCGVYNGKTITEYKYAYNADGDQTKYDVSTKKYNEEDVLIGEGTGTTTTTFTAAKDAKTDKYVYEGKEYSTKKYLTSKTKEEKTTESKWDKTYFAEQSVKGEKITTNRDGKVSYKKNTTKTYGEKGAFTEEVNQKYYNTYTGALTDEDVSKTVYYKNEETGKWQYDNTTTQTSNNDDGSLRSKQVVSTADVKLAPYGYYGGTVTEETHYNKDNKVAGKYTYDTKKEVGTWVDGNGKVIGKNEVTNEETEDYTLISVDFKDRTGDLHTWYTKEQKTDSKGTVTVTETYFDEGNKTWTEQTITDTKGSKYYENGVLRHSEDFENYEEKYYDIKGTLSSSIKYDEDATLYYDYNNKLIEKDYTDDSGRDVEAYYNPATGKVKKYVVSYGNTTEYRDADDKLMYSKEEWYGDVRYYDSKGNQFAHEYISSEDGVDIWQYAKKTDDDGKPVVMEKTESHTDSDYRKTTTTVDYTKWTISDGRTANRMTREDKTVTTWDNDQREVSEYVGGTLTQNTKKEKNDYDDVVKTTVKWYNWYDGKATATDKTINSGVPSDPITKYKYYDAAGNLQYYSKKDDTDSWNWWHTYYASGTLKEESWYDGLDEESGYDANYYRSGSLASVNSWTNVGGNTNGRYAAYNEDGSYRYWVDTVNNVSNEWVYNKNGQLEKYLWNNKTDSNGVQSFEIWNAAGTLLYTYTDYDNDWDDEVQTLADGTVETKTDPAGNKLAMKLVDGKEEYELSLVNKANGWQYAVGEWFYVENGQPVKEAWRQIGGSWYYFDADYTMADGIIAIQDKNDKDKYTTYAANDNGVVTRGWAAWSDFYGDTYWSYTNANGEVLTGWQNIDGQWYYFNDGWYQNTADTYYKEDVEWKQNAERGIMATGAVRIWNSDWNGMHTYFFNKDGTWDNTPGWKAAYVQVGSKDHETEPLYGVEYHYYDKNGKEVTGWNVIDGDWYYFNEDGVMRNGWVWSGSNWYFLDPAKGGAMAADGWAEDVYEGWYYMDKDGNYKTGWLQDGNNWYYLKSDGAMASKEWAKSGSDWYYMKEDGALATGWVQDHGNWYYLKSDGAMKTGWVGEGKTWYYLGSDGAMVADTDVTIDGTTYHFDETGLCTNP